MYLSKDDPTNNYYSDCARPHAARVASFEPALVNSAVDLLGARSADVTFFDQDTSKSGKGSVHQFCHAITVYLAPGSARNLAVDSTRPTLVVAFRGSSDAGAAGADLAYIKPKDAMFRGGGYGLAKVHNGFYSSLFDANPASCDPSKAGPPAASCADSIKATLDSYLAKSSARATILVTGHSLGAAEAALFALYLDQQANKNYDVFAYTYGQPKIGVGATWKRVYDGPNNLSQRTFGTVHNADPVAMLASSCQLPTLGADKQYVQVGNFIRVRTSDCSVKQPSSGTPISGECWGADGIVHHFPVCTISPPDSAEEDCSLWVGALSPAGVRASTAGSTAGRVVGRWQQAAQAAAAGTSFAGRFRGGRTGAQFGVARGLLFQPSGAAASAGSYSKCFCHALPSKLVIGLWKHHEHADYADHLGMCRELVSVAEPGPSGVCSTVPPGDQCNI